AGRGVAEELEAPAALAERDVEQGAEGVAFFDLEVGIAGLVVALVERGDLAGEAVSGDRSDLELPLGPRGGWQGGQCGSGEEDGGGQQLGSVHLGISLSCYHRPVSGDR